MKFHSVFLSVIYQIHQEKYDGEKKPLMKLHVVFSIGDISYSPMEILTE
jgi:hypothetical protein